jgi:hypothetical protein
MTNRPFGRMERADLCDIRFGEAMASGLRRRLVPIEEQMHYGEAQA